MDQPGLIERFVRRLVLLARDAGVDAERLAEEVAGHLAEASARYQADGMSAEEAERLAIEQFGEAEDVVHGLDSWAKGGAMKGLIVTVSTVVAVVATAMLLIAQIVPSHAVPGTLWEVMAVGAGITLAVAGLTLAWMSRRRPLGGRPRWRIALWLAASAALGAFAAWGGRIGPIHVPTGGRAYLAIVAVLALLEAIGARRLGSRVAMGTGLIIAGWLALLLNGAFLGAWRPLGSIGEGQANLGMELIVIGWVLTAMAYSLPERVSGIRSTVGGALVSLGRRLAPAPRPEG